MGRGGARSGAGRKRGSVTRKTTEIAQRAAAEGITPLEVILTAMRKRVEASDWAGAAAIAKDAAPYMHPRLATMQHSGPGGGPIATVDLSKLSNEQLAALEPILSALATAGGPARTGEGGTSPEG